MSEILLKPKEFQGQVDAFKSATSTVSGLKCEIDKRDVSLNSVDKMVECVAALNKMIESFSALATQDGETLQSVKSKWMNADDDVANKTLGEILFG